jgi:hypothetical protein
MLEYPDFFKVGIMSAGMGSVYDMYPDFHWELFEGPPVYSNGSNLRPTPASKPANYAGIDGPAQVERLRGKLLIMLGETDENVPAAATLRLIDALIREDKDFDMLYLPSQPHNFAGPHTWRRGWDYFVRHLAGREPPKGYRIGGN